MKRIADATCEDNRNKVKPRASDAEAYLQCLNGVNTSYSRR
jgi:hypothetical protein